ncbi:MAG: HAD family hydrolase [Haloarculaceae archaeon]
MARGDDSRADVAVWFDLDGTLLHLDHPYDAVLREAFGRHLEGPALDRAVGAYDFLDRFRAVEPEPYRTAMAGVVEAAEAGVGGTTVADLDPLALVDALREVEYAATEVPEGTRGTLAGIDAPVGVLTNGLPGWQRGKLAHHDLLSPFAAAVASYEAGAHKPGQAPFDLARERLAADRHVMVGDDREADVEGARAAGFEAIHAPDGIAAVRGDLRDLL